MALWLFPAIETELPELSRGNFCINCMPETYRRERSLIAPLGDSPPYEDRHDVLEKGVSHHRRRQHGSAAGAQCAHCALPRFDRVRLDTGGGLLQGRSLP